MEAGRSGIFIGKNNSVVIDGTYNGGLLSMTEGIESVKNLAKNEKIILFLGDMRELGPLEESSHKELAEKIIQTFNDKSAVQIFLVGKVMKNIVFPILEKNFSVTSELSSRIAGEKTTKIITENPHEKYIIFAK